MSVALSDIVGKLVRIEYPDLGLTVVGLGNEILKEKGRSSVDVMTEDETNWNVVQEEDCAIARNIEILPPDEELVYRIEKNVSK